MILLIGQKSVEDSSGKTEPESVELEVGGMKVVPLGERYSGEKDVLLTTAAGYEAASDFIKRSLYGDRHKRIPGLHMQLSTSYS